MKKIKKNSKKKKITKKVSSKQKPSLQLEKQLEDLIKRGRGRGFVTDAEVLYFFPKIEEDVSFLEKIYDTRTLRRTL